MKKAKTSSKLYIPYVVMIFIALACLITALCLCDYDFNGALAEIWQRNMPSFILALAFVALNLIFVISAIVLRVKNNPLTRDEVALAFEVAIVLLLEIILCVPIFIVWGIERIHDAVSDKHRENI